MHAFLFRKDEGLMVIIIIIITPTVEMRKDSGENCSKLSFTSVHRNFKNKDTRKDTVIS